MGHYYLHQLHKVFSSSNQETDVLVQLSLVGFDALLLYFRTSLPGLLQISKGEQPAIVFFFLWARIVHLLTLGVTVGVNGSDQSPRYLKLMQTNQDVVRERKKKYKELTWDIEMLPQITRLPQSWDLSSTEHRCCYLFFWLLVITVFLSLTH